jgi:glutamyl-tRNA synthetase
MSVRVRFAPSPTGHVHIGNIRAAIFNWLFARHEGGKFLLRIEDTDRERSTPEAVQAVLDSMEWLGLDCDEEPMYQSTRREAHLAAAEMLLEKGLAYKEDKGNTGKGECVVFRMPGEDMSFHDEIKGDLHKNADYMQDLVIVRSNGSPVFHLANVVDDIEMGITHVIRGDDHIENTYRHVALFKALGAESPKYAHLPMITNQQGKPYSKRDGDAFVGEFRDNGYHAGALFNYLTLLGWSPGDDKEKMDRDEIVELFSFDRVKSSPAQMDIKKLTAMNGDYIAEMPLADFVVRVREYIAQYDWATDVESDYFLKVCELMQTRTKTFTGVSSWKYFFSDVLEYNEKAVRKILKKDGVKEALECLKNGLDAIDFSLEGIEKALREVETEVDMQENKLNQPVRVALTGGSIGAGVYETIELLGKEKVVKRISGTLEKLMSNNE